MNNVRNGGRGRKERERGKRDAWKKPIRAVSGAGKPYAQILPRVPELFLTESPPLAFPSSACASLGGRFSDAGEIHSLNSAERFIGFDNS